MYEDDDDEASIKENRANRGRVWLGGWEKKLCLKIRISDEMRCKVSLLLFRLAQRVLYWHDEIERKVSWFADCEYIYVVYLRVLSRGCPSEEKDEWYIL